MTIVAVHKFIFSQSIIIVIAIPLQMDIYKRNIIENKKFFELKSKGYRDGIKRKETR